MARLYLGVGDRLARSGSSPVSLQFIVDGLLIGGLIGLGAIGVTLTYSILRFANFAHGEFISWGAYAALALAGGDRRARRPRRAARPVLLRLAGAPRGRARDGPDRRCSRSRSTRFSSSGCAGTARRSRW